MTITMIYGPNIDLPQVYMTITMIFVHNTINNSQSQVLVTEFSQ